MMTSASDPEQVPTLVHGFIRHAERSPSAVAIVDGGSRITYHELARASERVRRDLVTVGVRPGDRVGINMKRSWRAAAAIIGTLSAGASYVPLDPGYPESRRRVMAEDCRLRAVCVDEEHASAPWPGLSRVIVSGRAAETTVLADAAATSGYVMYTSGSTGRPKGVPIPQAHVLELFSGACRSVFSFNSDDVWTLCHSYSFDFSVWEMWGALLFGGTLVIADEALSRDPPGLLDLLQTERASVLSQVPTQFKYLVRAYEVEYRPLDSLRYVVFGGEAMDNASVRRWLSMRPGPEQLINMYGITETTVHVTAAIITSEDVGVDSAPTRIGRPLPHLRVALLGPENTVATGAEPGEICVSGNTLTSGYLGQAELTADRFPVRDLDGSGVRRWYRSGDLACREISGDLLYLGRLDSQVNLHGFRIELGEIEAALRTTDEVIDAAAAVASMSSGIRTLVALVVAARAFNERDVGQLRERCRNRLPTFMVPDRICVVDKIPTMPGGKVDRSMVAEVARQMSSRSPG